MGTKAKGDTCYEKAAMDEPLFVLRAQDATAPDTVEFWLSQNPQLAHTAKGNEAVELIASMRRWQNDRLRKIAD